MTARALAPVLAALVACGGGKGPTPTSPGAALAPEPETAADRVLAMLPPGPQLVVELDLARLRANPVVGRVVTRALAAGMELPGTGADGAGAAAGGEAGEAGESDEADAPSLAEVELVVLAAYGVGTAQAATITVLKSPSPVPRGVRIAEGYYALAPDDWAAQVAQRAALFESTGSVRADAELLALRERAMPKGAPGASLRITARLPFDARIALARQAGLEAAPAQLSLWGDVVDDLAVVIEADGSDPGDRRSAQAPTRLEAALRGALASLAAEPIAQALGMPRSFTNAKVSVRGAWVRAIIAVGPEHLKRVAARADALLPP